MNQRRKILAASLAFAALSTSGWSLAAKFPQSPIRFIVPWPPGGGADLLSRTLAEKLTVAFGVPVIVDNRTGAGGNIGAGTAAQASPNGYTMLFAYSGTHSVNPHLYRKMPFAEDDFAPVIWLSSVPQVLVVNSSLPVHTVNELIAYARENPGKLAYGSAGIGAINHLAGELFKTDAGVGLLHVPFRGGGPAVFALLRGDISVFFTDPASVLAHINAGTLRAVATTGVKRSLAFPNLPTVSEAGLVGFEVTSWNGVLVPAKTPQAIISTLNVEFNRVLKLPEIQKMMMTNGFEPTGGEPARFGALIHSESAKWARVVKATNMKVE